MHTSIIHFGLLSFPVPVSENLQGTGQFPVNAFTGACNVVWYNVTDIIVAV